MQNNYSGISTDNAAIDNVVKKFFSIFTNTGQTQPDWNIIYTVCIPEAIIIKKSNTEEIIYTLVAFIEPRKKILIDGTLTDFEEKETDEETRIINNIAQRYSKYQKSGNLNGTYFNESGNKLFQFIKTNKGWRISALVWEDDKN